MNPITETIERAGNDLRRLGVKPGDTVLVHASFRSLGPVPGGMETLIQALLRALGDAGTLLMPALSWALRPPQVFDVRSTPATVGAVAEYFRTRAGTRRSLHPTHSVCAVGPRTEELLGEHAADRTPCGPHSPFRKLADSRGAIVMLGCGLGPNTTMHALEECARPPYLFGPSFRFSMVDWEGRLRRATYVTHGFKAHGYEQRYDRVAELGGRDVLRTGRVLEAPVFILDAPALKRAAVARMQADPFFFVDRK